jgi:hypothetical protein
MADGGLTSGFGGGGKSCQVAGPLFNRHRTVRAKAPAQPPVFGVLRPLIAFQCQSRSWGLGVPNVSAEAREALTIGKWINDHFAVVSAQLSGSAFLFAPAFRIPHGPTVSHDKLRTIYVLSGPSGCDLPPL